MFERVLNTPLITDQKLIGKFSDFWLNFVVDGGWTLWEDYDKCSVSCGGGEQVSKRSCSNPSPAHGGKECVGETERRRKCGEIPCPGRENLISQKVLISPLIS